VVVPAGFQLFAVANSPVRIASKEFGNQANSSKWPSALENIKLFSTLRNIKSVSLDFIGKVVSILFKPIF
jgi:hypothetical protein